jgi:hypothetical protein
MKRVNFSAVFLLAISVASNPSSALGAVQDVPTDVARSVALEITREALLPPTGPDGRPLPLASQWNVGTVRGSFTPDHQIELLQEGHHILPWMAWPSKPGRNTAAYQDRLLRYFAELKLPVSMRGTQWNAMLVSKAFRTVPDELWAGVIAPDGSRKSRLSPFGSVEIWKATADAFVKTEGMTRAQQLYPDPPLVIWISNNEPPDLRWSKNGPLENISKRYLDLYGEGRSDDFKRRVVGEGWIERYNVMFGAMRDALTAPKWKENVRFVGYGAFGPSHFGRWGQWKDYSLITDEWTSPNWFFWEGGSPSYYTHNWNDNRDYWVFSTQVESMNWVFMLEEALRANPNFWFEMSTWDGNNVNALKQGLGVSNDADIADAASNSLDMASREQLDPKNLKGSKTLQYMAAGQDYPPERAAGWVQFGMWLLRPRVVREFRGHATPLAAVKPYWMETVYAVDRVWENEILASFWRFGTLVENPAHKHPYQASVPEKYKNTPRWFLLDTSEDADWPWDLKTPIPVFGLALVMGEAPSREWLVYAHAPVEAKERVSISIPGYKSVIVDVPRAGGFFLVKESDGGVTRVE